MQYHVAVINNSFRLRVRESIDEAMKDAQAFSKNNFKIVGLTHQQAQPLLEAELRIIRS